MATKKWYKENRVKMRAYRKKWYDDNKDKQKKIVNKRRQRLNEWLQQFKSTQKCSRCPESHPATLDFHHKDPSQKDMSIGDIIWQTGRPIEGLQEEIAKCEVLCSNCHRKLHWDEKNKT